MQANIHPVDEKLPAAKLFTLGIQHVLVMYAGAIAVPLIIGGALHLPKDQIAFLINADLFCCGLVTLIQALGIWKFGIRMPVMMGVTFAAVGPMVAMAGNPSLGILSIYGAVIASGILWPAHHTLHEPGPCAFFHRWSLAPSSRSSVLP